MPWYALSISRPRPSKFLPIHYSSVFRHSAPYSVARYLGRHINHRVNSQQKWTSGCKLLIRAELETTNWTADFGLMPRGDVCLVSVVLFPEAGLLEHGKEPSEPIHGWKYVDLLRYYRLIDHIALWNWFLLLLPSFIFNYKLIWYMCMGGTEYRAVNVYKITCILVHKDVYEIRWIVSLKDTHRHWIVLAFKSCDNLIPGMALWKKNLLICALATVVAFETLSLWSYALRETMGLLPETVLKIVFGKASQHLCHVALDIRNVSKFLSLQGIF
jgi:hypothetical protein